MVLELRPEPNFQLLYKISDFPKCMGLPSRLVVNWYLYIPVCKEHGSGVCIFPGNHKMIVGNDIDRAKSIDKMSKRAPEHSLQ